MRKIPLPSPRSPADLDHKILTYAKMRAPVQQFYRRPLWMSGLATASIIGIAVLISDPQQPLDSSIQTKESARQQPVIESRLEIIPAGLISKEIQETASGVSSTAIKAKMKPSKVYVPQATRAAAPMADMDSQILSDYAMEEIVVAEAKRAGSPTIDRETIQQIEKLSKLIDEGKTARAEAAYGELKTSCTNCILPATLGEAIKKYLPE